MGKGVIFISFFIFLYRSNRKEADSQRSIEDENQPLAVLRVPEVADVKEVEVCTVIHQEIYSLGLQDLTLFVIFFVKVYFVLFICGKLLKWVKWQEQDSFLKLLQYQ